MAIVKEFQEARDAVLKRIAETAGNPSGPESESLRNLAEAYSLIAGTGGSRTSTVSSA